MTTENVVHKTPDEVLKLNFELVEPLKDVYKKYKDNTIKELFDNVLDYQTDKSIFPRFEDFSNALSQTTTRVHGKKIGEEVKSQLEKSSVLHTQVHQSLMRSFDSKKRLDENNIAKPNEHYNTLVMQSEILWATLLKNKDMRSVSINSGLVGFSNETSPAYIQYGKSSEEALRMCNNTYHHNCVVSSHSLTEDRVLQIRKEIAKIQDKDKKAKAHKLFETVCSTEKFNDGVSKAYAEQLNDLFDNDRNKSVGVEGNEVLTEFMISGLENKESLTHYIFDNPEVTKFYYDSFSGIAMGWKKNQLTDKEGNETSVSAYDGFWGLKDIKKGKKIGKKTSNAYSLSQDENTGEIRSLSASEIVEKIRNEEVYPKNLHHINLSFLEAGILTIGGIAQAPYNTAVKNRVGEFIDNLVEKISNGELPPLPKSISVGNLLQRKNVIVNMETEIPVAGFGILLGEKDYELASYNDFIESNKKIGERELNSILNTNVGAAIKAAALPIVEYKLGEKDYSKLVGDKVVSIPQTTISEGSKKVIGKENKLSISRLPMTKEEYIADKKNKFSLYKNNDNNSNDNQQNLILATYRKRFAQR